MYGNQKCSESPPCSTCGGMVGWGLVLVSPQSSAGCLGECHSLGKLAQHDPLPALSLLHFGESPQLGLRPSPNEKSVFKWKAAAPCGWEGREGEARVKLLCHCDALHPQARPKTVLAPTLGTLGHLLLVLTLCWCLCVSRCGAGGASGSECSLPVLSRTLDFQPQLCLGALGSS